MRRASPDRKGEVSNQLVNDILGKPIYSPPNLWRSGRFCDRKLVLRLTFADRLAYCPNVGLRTPETTLPFKVLANVNSGKSKMAGMSLFELHALIGGPALVYLDAPLTARRSSAGLIPRGALA